MMDLLEQQLSKLRDFNTWVKKNDPRLFEEATVAAEAAITEGPIQELAFAPKALKDQLRPERIVLRTTLPMLAIKRRRRLGRDGFARGTRRTVTNRHVARRFAQHNGQDFAFAIADAKG